MHRPEDVIVAAPLQDHIAHHDVEMLPNGNILIMVWERKTAEEAELAGSNLAIDIFPEAIIEVDPSTDEIIWEWHAWDHLIQDFDDLKANFGTIADNPQLINLNYVPDELGDIMHGNGITYDKTNDLIFLSINFYHEVWVIDHSTTTEESATNTGGTYNKGGDLVYRFGNPTAYDNQAGERLPGRRCGRESIAAAEGNHGNIDLCALGTIVDVGAPATQGGGRR